MRKMSITSLYFKVANNCPHSLNKKIIVINSLYREAASANLITMTNVET